MVYKDGKEERINPVDAGLIGGPNGFEFEYVGGGYK
jgi:hypothetical protein